MTNPRKFRILLADDEPELLEELHYGFTAEGYQVQSVANGVAALEHFQQETFDLVITDLNMPEMDGFELLRNIKQLNREFPVIVMTGRVEPEDIALLLEAGAYDYLLKPVKWVELLFSVKRVQERQRLAGEKAFLISERQTQTRELISSLNHSMEVKISEITRQFYLAAKAHTEELTDVQMEQIQLLQTIPLFSGLGPADLRLITRRLNLHYIDADRDLLIQGQNVPMVYIIKEGVVDVLVNEDRVAQRGSMELVGEMSCLSGENPASATVRTVTPCQIWEIGRESFLEIVDNIPDLRLLLFTTLTGRLRQLTHRFSEILKHIPHGIVKIDPQGVITDEFSSRCADYLGINQLSGHNLGALLLSDDQNLHQRWEQVIESLPSLDDASLSEGLDQLPSEICYPHPQGRNRFLKMFYHALKDEHGRFSGLDIGFEDVTQSRQFQLELLSFQKLLTNLEQLLVLFETDTGRVIQETISQTRLGQTHFPSWKRINGQNVRETILHGQAPELLLHFDRWLNMLKNPYSLQSMSIEELVELAPRFPFETAAGKVTELVFSINTHKPGDCRHVLGRFEFIKTESSETAPGYSSMELMEEVMAAEKESDAALYDVLNEMEISLDIARSKLTSAGSVTQNHREIARLVHSIKGLGQSFGLSSIVNASHEVEDVLSQVKDNDLNPEVSGNLIQAFKSLLALIVIAKSLCNPEKEKDLGDPRFQEPEIRISLEQYQQLKNLLGEVKNAEDKYFPGTLNGDAFDDFAHTFSALDLMDLAVVYPRLQRIVADSGKLLNKKIEFTAVENITARLTTRIGHCLATCLVQMVKNAVYHGIETAADRRFLQKPDLARVELVIDRNDNEFLISVQDDGKGINTQLVLDRAVELKLLDPKKAKKLLLADDREAIFQFLFTPRFSTAESVSLISGRGVGMDLIKTEIKALGGNVILESTEGSGTRITLEIPMRPNRIQVRHSNRRIKNVT